MRRGRICLDPGETEQLWILGHLRAWDLCGVVSSVPEPGTLNVEQSLFVHYVKDFL